MYVCVGLASPFSLQTSIVSSQSAFALGLELAIVAPERNANAPRLVQFRAKGRAPDDAKEPPIQAHALGDTSMRVRPVESVAELSALIGSQVQHAHPPTHAPKPHAPRPTPQAVSDLRKLMLRSEIFSTLTKDLELIQGRNILTFLHEELGGPRKLTVSVQQKIGCGVLISSGSAIARGLEADRKEQGRTWTANKAEASQRKYIKQMQQLLQLADENKDCLYDVTHRKAQRAALEAQLLKVAPELEPEAGKLPPKPPSKAPPKAPKAPSKAPPKPPQKPSSEEAPAPSGRGSGRSTGGAQQQQQAAPAASEERGGASQKRGKDHIAGGSPAGKSTRSNDAPPSDVESGARPANLAGRFGLHAGLTPLAQGAAESNMAKVSELTDQLATLRLQQATQQVCICTTSMLGTQHAWHSS